jgi:hypothetical protein
MRYTAKLTQGPSGYSAQCVEIEAIGEGRSRQAALDSLQREIEDLEHVEGVALPPEQPSIPIEIVIVEESVEVTASGPGDPADPAGGV